MVSAMDALRAICDRDSFFLRSDALACGLDDRTLARAVRTGQLVRIRHGAYTFSDLWHSASAEGKHLIRAVAVMRTSRCACALSHTTAALWHGADVWDLPLGDVHLTRFDHKSGRKEAGVNQHRGLLVPRHETVAHRGRTCTTPSRTAIDITTITDIQHALVVVASLLHKELTTPEELADAAKRARHLPGSLTTDLVLRLADGRLQKPGEARSFYMFWREGLPAPEPQYEVHDGRGILVARLDFAWPEHRVWAEFDGRIKYQELLRAGESPTDVVLREKKREDLIRRLTGWTCIRITWSELERPGLIAAAIRTAMSDQVAIRRPGA